MDYSGLEKEIILKQGAYIRQPEEQPDIYQEKDRAQELLIEEQGRMSKPEQDSLCRPLLDAPAMHVDGTVARVDGSNNHVIVCSNRAATVYFARESKGHAAVKGTPVETFGGILIHGHEPCFYSYGSDHQECMVYIERYLKDSIENEKNLSGTGKCWN